MPCVIRPTVQERPTSSAAALQRSGFVRLLTFPSLYLLFAVVVGTLIGARKIPSIGVHITSFVPGASGVSPRRSVWRSAIAVIPGCIVMAAIGARLIKL